MLRGNLAPRWAITKQSATTLSLMTHTGRAVVFDSVEAMTLRSGAADLDVNADDVLVLRSAGPIRAPGMPEAGYLHRTPEAATGGPLALVRNGDSIRLNVAQCCIELLMDEAELALRRTARRAHQRRAGA